MRISQAPPCWLFGRNETIFYPAQHSAGRQVEHFSRLTDRHQFPDRCCRRERSAGDAAIVTQALNMPGSEAVSRHRATLLAIENSRDDPIGMMDSRWRMRSMVS
jgi:hypothetical protein